MNVGRGNGRPRGQPTCWSCHEVGHTNKTCPQYKRQPAAKKVDLPEVSQVQQIDGFKADIVSVGDTNHDTCETRKSYDNKVAMAELQWQIMNDTPQVIFGGKAQPGQEINSA